MPEKMWRYVKIVDANAARVSYKSHGWLGDRFKMTLFPNKVCIGLLRELGFQFQIIEAQKIFPEF